MASKVAHFAQAEKLLLANLKIAETFSSKDARLPLTLFDLAQIYRAEGRYLKLSLCMNVRSRSMQDSTATNPLKSPTLLTAKGNSIGV